MDTHKKQSTQIRIKRTIDQSDEKEKTMIYNFDEIIPRKGTNCIKYDGLKNIFKSADLLPLWVADMDFRTPDFIMQAVRERAQHDISYNFV